MIAAMRSRGYTEAIVKQVSRAYQQGDIVFGEVSQVTAQYKHIDLRSQDYILSGLEECEDWRDHDGYPTRFVKAQQQRMNMTMMLLAKFDDTERAEWFEQNPDVVWDYIFIRMDRAHQRCHDELNAIELDVKHDLNNILCAFDFQMMVDEKVARDARKGVDTYVD